MIDSKRPILRLKAGASAAPVLRVEYRVLKQEPEAEWLILRNGVDTGKSRRKKQSAIDLAILDARSELETAKANITVTSLEAGKTTTEWTSA